MAAPFFLTTPIYYVNAKPHLGHAYTTIMADTLTRVRRMLGEDTWFLTGTDEHGEKIVQAAQKAGMEPQPFTDEISARFRELWKHLGLAPDCFVRTTDPAHKAIVRAFLQRVYDRGDIYFGEYGGHYCYGCERFYTEKELEDGLCPQHRTKPEYISEKNYFFRMGKYQDALRAHIADNPDFIRPERYRTETLALLDSGALEDLCISRPKSRLTWGIELPFDPDFVCYVWFDALLSYISPLGGPEGEPFRRYWPGGQHLVAKDILKPHAIFWPTMLMSAGVPLYRHLNVHGYWIAGDAKMSKSLGNVVDPMAVPEQYGMDAFRYFLLREMQFGADASFTEEALVGRFNADLANDLGNLFSRVLSMAARYHASRSPACGALEDADLALRDLAADAVGNFVCLFDAMQPAQALSSLWELVRALNRYVDSQAPWSLAKAGNAARLDTVMSCLLEGMYKTACCLWPIMPDTSAAMLRQLGMPGDRAVPPLRDLAQEAERWGAVRPGLTLAASSNLFPRREPSERRPAAEPAPASAVEPAQRPPYADFADFQKLDLRVGRILEAQPHPNADKLLKLAVDLGEEVPRQIISGLAGHFAPQDLAGRMVCVVANLAPRVIRGLESQGMILTAESDGKLRLLAPAGDAPPGSRIT